MKDEGVNYSLNAPLTAHEGGSSSGGVSGKVEAVHGIHLTGMCLIIYTIYTHTHTRTYTHIHTSRTHLTPLTHSLTYPPSSHVDRILHRLSVRLLRLL